MRTYDPDIQEQFDTGRIDRRDAILFMFDEGNFGFFAGGSGTLPWNGDDYVGAGSLAKVTVGGSDTSKTQESIEIVLASKYEVDGEVVELFTKEELEGIEAFSYYRRPAILGRFYISEAGQIIDFVQTARCEVHAIEHDEDDRQGYSLRIVLEGLGAFRKHVDAKTRNKELQAQIDDTDRGLDNVGTIVNEKVYWGGKPPETKP